MDSGTETCSSLKIFIRGWYKEKENIRNIINTKTKKFFLSKKSTFVKIYIF